MTRILIYLVSQDFLSFISEVLYVAEEIKGAGICIAGPELIDYFSEPYIQLLIRPLLFVELPSLEIHYVQTELIISLYFFKIYSFYISGKYLSGYNGRCDQ